MRNFIIMLIKCLSKLSTLETRTSDSNPQQSTINMGGWWIQVNSSDRKMRYLSRNFLCNDTWWWSVFIAYSNSFSTRFVGVSWTVNVRPCSSSVKTWIRSDRRETSSSSWLNKCRRGTRHSRDNLLEWSVLLVTI